MANAKKVRIGEKFAKAIEGSRFSKSQLSKWCGHSSSYITLALTNGEIAEAEFKTICEILGEDPDVLKEPDKPRAVIKNPAADSAKPNNETDQALLAAIKQLNDTNKEILQALVGFQQQLDNLVVIAKRADGKAQLAVEDVKEMKSDYHRAKIETKQQLEKIQNLLKYGNRSAAA